MGFGLPLDATPYLAYPGAITHSSGVPGLRLIADRLGCRIDEIRERFDRVATDRDLQVAFGTAEAGTSVGRCAPGHRCDRRPRSDHHRAREPVGADLGLEWGDRVDRPIYQVRIEGEPDIACTMNASLREPGAFGSAMDAGAGAMVSTAMRVVNAIPYVVQVRFGRAC